MNGHLPNGKNDDPSLDIRASQSAGKVPHLSGAGNPHRPYARVRSVYMNVQDMVGPPE